MPFVGDKLHHDLEGLDIELMKKLRGQWPKNSVGSEMVKKRGNASHLFIHKNAMGYILS